MEASQGSLVELTDQSSHCSGCFHRKPRDSGKMQDCAAAWMCKDSQRMLHHLQDPRTDNYWHYVAQPKVEMSSFEDLRCCTL